MEPRIRSRVERGGLVLAAIGVIAACNDREMLGPSSTGELARPTGVRVAKLLAGDSPDEAVGSTVHDTLYGGGPEALIAYYPNWTVVQATASGWVGWTSDWGTTGSWAAGGYDGGMYGAAVITERYTPTRTAASTSFGSPFLGQWTNPVAKIVMVKDSVFAGRSVSPINTWNSEIYYCGPMYPANPRCYAFLATTTTITLLRVTADLQFSADSTNVKVGSTVTFKNRIVNPSVAGVSLPKQVLRYVWTPDDTSRGGNPTELVDSSAAACTAQAGDSTCTRVLNGSGTLRIVARVNGRTIEKSVRVNAIACPTGDPVLDHKEVRKGLLQMWQSSNPDSAPGSGRNSTCRDAQGNPISCGVKREQGAWILKRPDGSYYTVPVIPSYHDECSIEFPSSPPAEAYQPGAMLWGVAHSHPAKIGDKVYCKRVDQYGQPIDLYPNDPVGQSVGNKGSDYAVGGGSPKDWKMAQESPNIDVYVMNGNDEIHRLPAYTPKGNELQNRNQRRKYWRGNKATCPF